MNNSIECLLKPKLINSFSQLCNNTMNKSFQYNSDSDNSVSNQQLLLMQLKQLRRQNKFLKKKIQQLKSHNPLPIIKQSKRNSLNYLKTLKHRNSISSNLQQKKQSTISIVIKEVQNILKSLSMVYKVDVDGRLWYDGENFQGNCINNMGIINHNSMGNIHNSSNIGMNNSSSNIGMNHNSNNNNNNSNNNNNNNNNNNIDIFSSQKLFLQQQRQFNLSICKRLQLTSLSPEPTRYQQILSIFSQFYSYKKQIQQYLKSRLSFYIQQTLSISQQLLQKISSKQQQKSMMKSSNTYSLHYSNIHQDNRNNSNNWTDVKEVKELKQFKYLKESNCDLKDSLTNDTWKRIDKAKSRSIRFSTIDPVIREDNQ